MKKLNIRILLGLIVSSLVLVSCGDDDDTPDVSPYVGKYTIQSAIVSESPNLEIIYGEDTMSVPFIGQDFTDMIKDALLGVVEDCSDESAYFELRDDYTMYLGCATGSFELSAGVWKEEDSNTLDLSFNSAAIPSSPTGYEMVVKNVKLEDGIMYSSTIIPIPRDAIAAAMEEDGRAILTENNPDPVMFTFDLEFKKIE
ncbi:MAG: hypothetical protein GXO47_09555 [Chlorobi bacterium]|nr:hypothetical protein [Chlorobiota bacterium]